VFTEGLQIFRNIHDIRPLRLPAEEIVTRDRKHCVEEYTQLISKRFKFSDLTRRTKRLLQVIYASDFKNLGYNRNEMASAPHAVADVTTLAYGS
jgi:hypothetical protein